MKQFLLTGGAGYIGSHTAVEMLNAGFDIVIADNFVNSSRESIRRVEEITGKKCKVVNVDILDEKSLEGLFQTHQFESVIHFAALKAVGESAEKPLLYYHNNVAGTINLIRVMEKFGCRNIVFSSSATVYGQPQYLPLDEHHPLAPTNPYGKTKYFIEEILSDVARADSRWSVILLRYFNPVGAHPSGRIGEDPCGIPNNLMPFVNQVAVGKLPFVHIFGDDYDTPDGTGVRDYIHVVDLALGHVCAVRKLCYLQGGIQVYNLGTGCGYSVLEMIAALEKASGRKIQRKIAPRRPGDIATCYADPAKARTELKWKSLRGLEEMCQDMWRWQTMNPNGFDS